LAANYLRHDRSLAQTQRDEVPYHIRMGILGDLGGYGKNASAALPWLDKLAANPAEGYGGENLSRKAKEVADLIREIQPDGGKSLHGSSGDAGSAEVGGDASGDIGTGPDPADDDSSDKN